MKRPKLDSFPVLLVFAIIAPQVGSRIARALNHGEALSNGAVSAVGGLSITLVFMALWYLERWLVRRGTKQP